MPSTQSLLVWAERSGRVAGTRVNHTLEAGARPLLASLVARTAIGAGMTFRILGSWEQVLYLLS